MSPIGGPQTYFSPEKHFQQNVLCVQKLKAMAGVGAPGMSEALHDSC